MALALYSMFLQFPDGTPAANYPMPVCLMGSNVLVPLFTDQSGTAGPNPVMTDGFGQVVFWAAPGCYEVHLAGDHIHIPLDDSFADPVWPDLVVHEQATAASVWTVEHYFGVRPAVDVVTVDGVTITDVDHLDDLTVAITFGAPTAGTAYLRR